MRHVHSEKLLVTDGLYVILIGIQSEYPDEPLSRIFRLPIKRPNLPKNATKRQKNALNQLYPKKIDKNQLYPKKFAKNQRHLQKIAKILNMVQLDLSISAALDFRFDEMEKSDDDFCEIGTEFDGERKEKEEKSSQNKGILVSDEENESNWEFSTRSIYIDVDKSHPVFTSPHNQECVDATMIRVFGAEILKDLPPNLRFDGKKTRLINAFVCDNN